MILSKLFVQGFRAIGPSSTEIALAPLTVLVGKNGCGKTSLLEAIGLTAQSAVEQPDLHNWVLTGERVDFGYAAEDSGSLFYGRAPGARVSIGLEVQSPPVSIGSHDRLTAKGLGFVGWPPARFEYRWTRSNDRFPSWWHEFVCDGVPAWQAWTEYTQARDGSGATGYTYGRLRAETPFSASLMTARVLGTGLIPPSTQPIASGSEGVNPRQLGMMFDLLRPLTLRLRDKLAKVQFVSALRGMQLMNTEVGPDVEIVGKHGEQFVRLWSRMQTTGDRRMPVLKEFAERFGLRNFSAGWAGGKTLKATYDDEQSAARLDLQSAAGGSLHAMILAAQVLMTPRDSVVLIDEPELGLHPAYEKQLPELFLNAVALGQQVILTTHSEVFVAALANAVRRGVGDATDATVAIWHLDRGPGGVTADRVGMSKRGYLERWVKSFAEVENDLFQEWTDPLPRKGQARSDRHTRIRKGRVSESGNRPRKRTK